MVDLSQSPSPNKVLGFFHSNIEKGNPINDKSYGKADLALVRQKRPATFPRRTSSQHGGISAQASAHAAQLGSGILAEVQALTG